MDETTPFPWLPASWAPPLWVEVDAGHHLRPIGPDDTELDMPAGPGSREQDRADLQRTAEQARAHQSFDYALFDADETVLVGCVHIDRTDRPDADADISWWVRRELRGSPIEAALDAFVPAWIAARWPLTSPRYVGRDLTWGEWPAIPPATPAVGPGSESTTVDTLEELFASGED